MNHFRAVQAPRRQVDAVAAMMAFALASHSRTVDKNQPSIPAQNADISTYRAEGAVTIRTTDIFAQPVSLIPSLLRDWIEFQGYAEAWKAGRRLASSFAKDLVANEHYLNIIGMGDRAVPCILQQLQSELAVGEPDHWFVALLSTAKTNPVPSESRGKILEMARAWVEWGKREGFLNASVGVTVSPSR